MGTINGKVLVILYSDISPMIYLRKFISIKRYILVYIERYTHEPKLYS